MRAIAAENYSAVSTQISSTKQKTAPEQENAVPCFASVFQQTTGQRRVAAAVNQKEATACPVDSVGNSYPAASAGQPADWFDKVTEMICQFLNQPDLKSGEYFYMIAARDHLAQKMREKGISMDKVDMSAFFLEIAKEADAYVENATGEQHHLLQRAQEWLKSGGAAVAATA